MKIAKPFEVSKKLVGQAYLEVKSKGGAAGVDGESLELFERNLKNNLYRIWNRLCSGSYFPPSVKAVPIPKKSGGTRVLGVPTVSDRIAQTVVKESGYRQQARVENSFFRYKSVFGGDLKARHSKAQRREAAIGCHILNRMAELGRPSSYALGR